MRHGKPLPANVTERMVFGITLKPEKVVMTYA
jgi:hypothetical protein